MYRVQDAERALEAMTKERDEYKSKGETLCHNLGTKMLELHDVTHERNELRETLKYLNSKINVPGVANIEANLANKALNAERQVFNNYVAQNEVEWVEYKAKSAKLVAALKKVRKWLEFEYAPNMGESHEPGCAIIDRALAKYASKSDD